MMSRLPTYKIDYFIHQILSSQFKNAHVLLKEKHTLRHALPFCTDVPLAPAQRCQTTGTSFRCCIWWKRGCITTATTLNCTRRAMHVGFSIATIRPIAMTHASSFGRPMSQKAASCRSPASKIWRQIFKNMRSKVCSVASTNNTTLRTLIGVETAALIYILLLERNNTALATVVISVTANDSLKISF